MRSRPTVHRFRIWAHDCDPEVTPDIAGQWVRYRDYEDLSHENATLRKRNAEMEAEATIREAVLAERDNKVAELRAALRARIRAEQSPKDEI